jgi:hypothetical protein
MKLLLKDFAIDRRQFLAASFAAFSHARRSGSDCNELLGA